MLRVCVLVLALSSLCLPCRAGAAGLTLEWSAPSECGTRAELEAGVEHIVGQPLSALASSWSEVKVAIEQASPGSYRLVVLVVAGSGARRERSVVTGTCREAVEAAELIVATSLGGAPPAESSEPLPSSEPTALPQPEPEPAPSAQPAPIPPVPAPNAQPSRPPASEFRLAAGARVGLEANLLPKASEFAALALAAGTDAFTLELSAGSTLWVHDPVPPGTVGLLLQRAALDACARFTRGSFALEPCAGLELGRLIAEGKDLPAASTQTGFWSAALLDGRVAWRVKPAFSWVGGLELAVPLRRLEVALAPGKQIFLTPPVGFRPFLGIEVGFH
jgi:hypothetical protein